MSHISSDTRIQLIVMETPMWDRMCEEKITEMPMWHADRSEFSFCKPVVVTQTYRRTFGVQWLCETATGERIDSSDLFDHEPTLVIDEDGARYWQ